MQVSHQFIEPTQKMYHDFKNLELQSHLFRTDLILKRLEIRERYLLDKIVYAVKNNLALGMIYAKELQQVRIAIIKISNINQQMKKLQNFVIASKKLLEVK